MKSPLILSLALGLFAANAFALPNQIPQPLLGEFKDSRQEVRSYDRHVAEGGAERLQQQRLRMAEDGSERTPGQQRLRLAEGGAERLQEHHTRG
ncbi:hypothetical protein [Pseudomonas benzenivorans]|uniref:Phage infection protein n=1 Tax=Pseudomonas benzenivorans TaxID=556533 RepID=A0ABY5HB99_9PSED|nr:hypothetical protein [Pseudomonas benzenivorans]UTW09254.1 hypothetical protein KDW96_08135 [Pseudomonas benzenivorans]